MLEIPKRERNKILVCVAIMIIAFAIATAVSGCAFNHRSETTWGVLTDQETSSGGSSSSHKRPARD